MKNSRFLLCLLLCLFFAENAATAQRTQNSDSVLLKKHNPKLAIGLSAVLPGAGQIYNKKWWKVPIIYAGLGASVYFICSNAVETHTYQLEYRYRMQGNLELLNPQFSSYSDDNVLSLKKYYQRNMEIAIAATAIIYVLNIIDAAVDAHLFYFDISDDLSLQMSPYVTPTSPFQTGNAGVAMFFQLK